MAIRLAATCPLCDDDFDDAGSYRAHLAETHGLVDDEGTETTLDAVEPEAEPEPPIEPAPPATERDEEPGRVDGLTLGAGAPATPPRHPAAAPIWLALLVVVQLLLGLAGLSAVGRDDEPAERVAAARGLVRAPVPTAPVNTAADPLLDQQLANGSVVRAGDLPPGWVELDRPRLEAEGDRNAAAAGGRPAPCVAIDAMEARATAIANSAFAFENSVLADDVAVYATEAEAGQAYSVLDANLACATDAAAIGVAASGARDGLPLATASSQFQPMVGFPHHGDQSFAKTAHSSVMLPGFEGAGSLQIDVMVVRQDRAVATVVAMHIAGGSMSPAEERAAFASVADRMAGSAV